MRVGIIASVVWAAILMTTTGCSGLELGGKVGLYAVDERREVQETASKSMPLKCRFVSCAGEGYHNDK